TADISPVHDSKRLRHSQPLTNHRAEEVRIRCQSTPGKALRQVRGQAVFKLPQLKLLQDPHLLVTYNKHDLIPPRFDGSPASGLCLDIPEEPDKPYLKTDFHQARTGALSENRPRSQIPLSEAELQHFFLILQLRQEIFDRVKYAP